MTKELIFDLHFSENGIEALTMAGRAFLNEHDCEIHPITYKDAVEKGLHVRFQNAEVRDMVASYYQRKEDRHGHSNG